MVKIGIIGGSGLDDPNLIENYQEIEVETPFGKPSSKLITGKISGIEVIHSKGCLILLPAFYRECCF